MPKYNTIHQYEPLRAPESWDEDGRRFVVRLTEILDDIYRRYGRLGLKDIGTGFQSVITTLQSGVTALRVAYQALSERVDGKLDKKSVVSSLTTTDPGCALDASQAPALLLSAHPVGSLYMSVDETSPATLFGGTWERLKDRFVLAAGDAYAAGTTGGEAAHALTVSEMPSHTHTYVDAPHLYAERDTSQNSIICPNGTESANAMAYNTGAIGSGAAHNNMPPYLAVYMWKRTA